MNEEDIQLAVRAMDMYDVEKTGIPEFLEDVVEEDSDSWNIADLFARVTAPNVYPSNGMVTGMHALAAISSMEPECVDEAVEYADRVDTMVGHVSVPTSLDYDDVADYDEKHLPYVLSEAGGSGTVYVTSNHTGDMFGDSVEIDTDRATVARDMSDQNQIITVQEEDYEDVLSLPNVKPLGELSLTLSQARKYDLSDEAKEEVFDSRMRQAVREVTERLPVGRPKRFAASHERKLRHGGFAVEIIGVAIQLVLLLVGMSVLPGTLVWLVGFVMWAFGSWAYW